MTLRISSIFALLVCTAAFGQVSFEVQSPPCTYAFPIGCASLGDAEGISFNGALTLDVPAFGATVGTANGLGMPCGGAQFLRLQCANPNFAAIPAGGPIPESATVARLWIPVPPGAVLVSICWDFYAAEAQNSNFNDAVAIDVIGGCGGPFLSNLVYADMHSPAFTPVVDATPCGVIAYIPANGVRKLSNPPGSSGSQVLSVAPLPAGAVYLRLSAANGTDNAVTGQLVVDFVSFVGPVIPNCATFFSSPFGPGSVMMANTVCPFSAGRSYFTAIDLTAGSYPSGWFFGLDISLPELVNELAAGPPFTGVLNWLGYSTTPGFGPAPALTGLTLFAVTTEWTTGFGAFLSARPSTAYVIP